MSDREAHHLPTPGILRSSTGRNRHCAQADVENKRRRRTSQRGPDRHRLRRAQPILRLPKTNSRQSGNMPEPATNPLKFTLPISCLRANSRGRPNGNFCKPNREISRLNRELRPHHGKSKSSAPTLARIAFGRMMLRTKRGEITSPYRSPAPEEFPTENATVGKIEVSCIKAVHAFRRALRAEVKTFATAIPRADKSQTCRFARFRIVRLTGSPS